MKERMRLGIPLESVSEQDKPVQGCRVAVQVMGPRGAFQLCSLGWLAPVCLPGLGLEFPITHDLGRQWLSIKALCTAFLSAAHCPAEE